MVRTEMDALPMEEKSGLPYASRVTATWNGKQTPVAHSCGHDIHMASWVGTAQALIAMKSKWHGTLMFVGQPAEETTGGARGMIADGIFTKFPKPDVGFALHVGPAGYGEVTYRPGVNSSNSDSMEILFKGKGGHGSTPSITIDPVIEAARFTMDVQTVVSREKDPAAFGVITVGAIQSGNAGNIIPDTALLRGTIRSYDSGVRAKLLDGIRRTAAAVAAMAAALRRILTWWLAAALSSMTRRSQPGPPKCSRPPSAPRPRFSPRPARKARTIRSSSLPACRPCSSALAAMIRPRLLKLQRRVRPSRPITRPTSHLCPSRPSAMGFRP